MTQAIDISQLEMMTSGDPALAVEALGIFRQSAELWSRLLDAGADAEQWADAAHGIKGAARSIGAMALGDASEKLGRSGMASRVEAVVAISAIKDTLGQALESMAHVEHQLVMRRSFDGVRLDA